MIRRPPRSTRTDTLFPYTTLFRSLMLLLSSGAVAAAPLDQAGRTEILTNAARLIETRYVDPANGARIAAALLNARGKWADVTDPKQFAEQVTRWLRSVSSDGHLGLSYSEEPIAKGDPAGFTAAEMEKWYGAHLNHGIEKIERLPGNRSEEHPSELQ